MESSDCRYEEMNICGEFCVINLDLERHLDMRSFVVISVKRKAVM